MFDELDTVRLVKNVPEQRLTAGMIGAVVMVHTRPNLAYEVEFVADDGETIALLPLTPDFLQLQQSFHKQPLAA